MTTDPRLEPEQKEENLTIPVVAENKRIPIPEPVEEEPKKRGFLSRFSCRMVKTELIKIVEH
jgi:hypothetical protein